MIACYCLVSYADQNLERQRTATSEYAQSQLGADPSDVEFYEDDSTGTDVNRDAYCRMMADLEADAIDVIVVDNVSRIARSINRLEQIAKRVRDADTELHIVNQGMIIKSDEDDPYQQATSELLDLFAGLEVDFAKMASKENLVPRPMNEEHRYGPAPLGFEKDGGHLVEGSNYHQVCAVLEMVMEDKLSKRKAAKELGTSRATIDRALDRTELYNL